MHAVETVGTTGRVETRLRPSGPASSESGLLVHALESVKASATRVAESIAADMEKPCSTSAVEWCAAHSGRACRPARFGPEMWRIRRRMLSYLVGDWNEGVQTYKLIEDN